MRSVLHSTGYTLSVIFVSDAELLHQQILALQVSTPTQMEKYKLGLSRNKTKELQFIVYNLCPFHLFGIFLHRTSCSNRRFLMMERLAAVELVQTVKITSPIVQMYQGLQLRARLANSFCTLSCLDSHFWGQSCLSIVDSVFYLITYLSMRSSSSDEDAGAVFFFF